MKRSITTFARVLIMESNMERKITESSKGAMKVLIVGSTAPKSNNVARATSQSEAVERVTSES